MDLIKVGIPRHDIDIWSFPKLKREENGVSLFNHKVIDQSHSDLNCRAIDQSLCDLNHKVIDQSHSDLNTNNGGDKYSMWNTLITGNNPDPVSVDISKSHLKVIQDAFDKGYQNILVFEDDARFDPLISDIEGKIKKITHWLSKNKWDIFYFGCTVYPPLFNKKITECIDKTLFPMASHAYAMSRSGMAKVLADSHKITIEYVPIDTYYRNNFNLNKYMIYPSINKQCKPPALYQKTADLIGLDYIIDYYQCCHLLENFSHHSRSIISVLVTFLLYACLSTPAMTT